MSGERISEAEFAEIEARANAATPGPWGYDADECIVESNGWSVVELGRSERFGHSTGAFIAAAREDVPRLVQEVRRLRAENAKLQEWCVESLPSGNIRCRICGERQFGWSSAPLVHAAGCPLADSAQLAEHARGEGEG